jgi:hypothetical protein
MGRSPWYAGALALAWLHPFAASAADDRELEQIRAQIRELKASYEARIQALEQRLKAAEEKASAAPPASPPVASAAPAQAGTQSNLAAFNPAISAIVAGSYANLSLDPASYRLHGFALPDDAGRFKRGFSLAESELTFSANVDPRFSGTLTFSVSPDNHVEVEEAYGLYNGAPAGVVPKFGRFLSGVGYLNEQHAHAWDFIDTPLAYQAFLGGQYRTDGVQLRWIAPTEHYIELGGEVGNGEALPGAPRDRNGANAGVAFARTGGDVGESHSWLAGVSYLRTRDDSASPDPVRQTAAQFVWKWAPNGNSRERNFKLQGEWIWSQERAGIAPRQDGGYVQAVYQFMPTWRAGVRYDRLDPRLDDFHPQRATAMIDWNPSEFSRLRLQFARARLAPDLTDNEVFLQYILSIGAHGAHKY